MDLPDEARVQFIFFYAVAALYGAACCYEALFWCWAAQIAALALGRRAPRALALAADAATHAIGYWHATRAPWSYQFAWCASNGTALGVWAASRMLAAGDDLVGAVARRLLVVLSHVAIMRGLGGPPIWPLRPPRGDGDGVGWCEPRFSPG